LILLSTSGTRLIFAAGGADATYLACFRNYEAVARYLISHHDQVAIIGAGSRGEFREEDQMCCAWIGGILEAHGFRPANGGTAYIVRRWRDVPAHACANGPSAKYLARTGYLKDLHYILEHVNDLKTVFSMNGGEVVEVVAPAEQAYEALA
jgi:2-phosphosulfolactate phosphatase